MISNPNLLFYACIAKGPTILTEFTSPNETEIQTIAQRCIEKAPAHHSVFSHTIRNKTYTFLMADPFVYFAIFGENVEKLDSLWYLNRVKSAFEVAVGSNSMKDGDKLTTLCFQGQFHTMFRDILSPDAELVSPLTEESKVSRDLSMESPEDGGKKKKTVAKPFVVMSGKMLMKKKKRLSGDANGAHPIKDGGDVDDKVNILGETANREFSVPVMQKSGGGGAHYLGDGKQKAKQIWRKHVWVVLILDLVICAVLFGVWLWVCRGFKCIDG